MLSESTHSYNVNELLLLSAAELMLTSTNWLVAIQGKVCPWIGVGNVVRFSDPSSLVELHVYLVTPGVSPLGGPNIISRCL